MFDKQVKVGGNQGRMAGRRLPVGFLQIVPGVFPTGVYTDRLPLRGLVMAFLFDFAAIDDILCPCEGALREGDDRSTVSLPVFALSSHGILWATCLTPQSALQWYNGPAQ